jgi:hypothetical protein
MKKIILAAVFMTTMTFMASSQTNTEEIDYIQSIFGMAKKSIVQGFIDLESFPEDEFWQLYDEYESARKEFGKKRLKLLDSYANDYMTMDDEKTDEIIKSMTIQKKNLDKLIVKYYKKMKKSVGSKPAAQFYQLENYFLSAIRLTILENIPFIGEI